MTKLEKLKVAIGYTRERICKNCKHYNSQLTPTTFGGLELNIRCRLHGFKVHKTAVCNSWERK